MKIRELIGLLQTVDPDHEVRVGDFLTTGPYKHTSLGGIWRIDGGVVICASAFEEWHKESESVALPRIFWADD
jgi:hypothetical protein